MNVTNERDMSATMSTMVRTMVRTMVKTKTGGRLRALKSPRALWDRSFARGHLPAPRGSSSANLTPVSSTDRCPSKHLRGVASLIANPELEFHVSPIRITKLRFSNRKYSPLFRPPWRIAISLFRAFVRSRSLPACPEATRRRTTSRQQISNRYTAIRISRNQTKTNAILNS